MKPLITTFFLWMLAFTSIGQTTNPLEIVKIGNTEWCTQNLSVVKFNNGDPIKLAVSEAEWKLASDNKIPAYCFSQMNGERKEILYNYYVLIDPRGILPQGYSFPKEVDFKSLDEEFYKYPNLTRSMNFTKAGCRKTNGSFANYGMYFWYRDTDSDEYLKKYGYGSSFMYLQDPIYPEKFPLFRDGKWGRFDSEYEIGGAKAGIGKSIRLVKTQNITTSNIKINTDTPKPKVITKETCIETMNLMLDCIQFDRSGMFKKPETVTDCEGIPVEVIQERKQIICNCQRGGLLSGKKNDKAIRALQDQKLSPRYRINFSAMEISKQPKEEK